MSVFIPGNAVTMIDFECVPTYSRTLAAEIINMNDNVIIPQTSLKSGMIATFLCYKYLLLYSVYKWVRL